MLKVGGGGIINTMLMTLNWGGGAALIERRVLNYGIS